MNGFEIDGLDGVAVDISQTEGVDSVGRWKRTFRTIEATLKDICEPEVCEKILDKMASAVSALATYGDTNEDLVLEIAQLYIFSKEANVDAETFENAFGTKVVQAINLLNQDLDSNDKLNLIFENHEFAFLNKIKLAEYIADLAINNYSEEEIDEIDLVIKNFEGRTQKGLMKKLVEERNKL